MSESKKVRWNKLKTRYRLSVVNEDTLTESWNYRLTRWEMFAIGCLSLAGMLVIGVLLLLYTPFRMVLPDDSERLRQELVASSARVDSLVADMNQHRQYLDVVRKVVGGEIAIDSITPLDSIVYLMHDQLLLEESEATRDFVEQYESKASDYLQFFDDQRVDPTRTLFKPVDGLVEHHVGEPMCPHGILVRAPQEAPVKAVLAGSIVSIELGSDNMFTIYIQHTAYLSVYRHIGSVKKEVGDYLQAGTIIGTTTSNQLFGFEIWQDGKCVDPEQMIVF